MARVTTAICSFEPAFVRRTRTAITGDHRADHVAICDSLETRFSLGAGFAVHMFASLRLVCTPWSCEYPVGTQFSRKRVWKPVDCPEDQIRPRVRGALVI